MVDGDFGGSANPAEWSWRRGEPRGDQRRHWATELGGDRALAAERRSTIVTRSRFSDRDTIVTRSILTYLPVPVPVPVICSSVTLTFHACAPPPPPDQNAALLSYPLPRRRAPFPQKLARGSSLGSWITVHTLFTHAVNEHLFLEVFIHKWTNTSFSRFNSCLDDSSLLFTSFLLRR